MIYVPDLENYVAFSLIDSNTLRAYESMPQINESVNYRDYYINSHYLYQDNFSLIETSPQLIDNSLLTSSFYYRNDFTDILIIFMILSIFCFYLPIRIFSRLFKKARL